MITFYCRCDPCNLIKILSHFLFYIITVNTGSSASVFYTDTFKISCENRRCKIAVARKCNIEKEKTAYVYKSHAQYNSSNKRVMLSIPECYKRNSFFLFYAYFISCFFCNFTRRPEVPGRYHSLQIFIARNNMLKTYFSVVAHINKSFSAAGHNMYRYTSINKFKSSHKLRLFYFCLL